MAAADNSLIDFGTKMSEIGSELENDLRVWWDNSPATMATTTSAAVVYDMDGNVCEQPAFVAAAGELTMEEKFVLFPTESMSWESAQARCQGLGL